MIDGASPNCSINEPQRLEWHRLAPYAARLSEKFLEEHGGRIGDVAVYGQESNSTTRRLAMMNLAIRGIEADLGPEHASKLEAANKTNLKGLGCGSGKGDELG